MFWSLLAAISFSMGSRVASESFVIELPNSALTSCAKSGAGKLKLEFPIAIAIVRTTMRSHQKKLPGNKRWQGTFSLNLHFRFNIEAPCPPARLSRLRETLLFGLVSTLRIILIARGPLCYH